MTTLYVLWIILLVVTVLVLPFIVKLLNDVLRASRSIERYFKEMLEAGVGIANNTEHIKALNSTIEVASGILNVAGQINDHTGALGGALKSRAEKQN
jgi:hypothetical protein